MRHRRQQLAARREVLIARSARLREEIGEDALALGLRFRLADRVVAFARSGKSQLLLGAAATVLLFGRPRRLLKIAFRLAALWPVLAPFLPQLKSWLRRGKRDEASA